MRNVVNMLQKTKPLIKDIQKILQQVYDPEIPVLNIFEMGIVRNIKIDRSRDTPLRVPTYHVCVTITPTYSGCPAMKMIEENIIAELNKNGFYDVKLKTDLFSVWTTDWLTDEAKDKLKEYGIAPPSKKVEEIHNALDKPRACPLCNSKNTSLISQFGSTPCKALYRCNKCLEPFDYFKCY